MHQNPVERTVRFIMFSIGFVLFVMLAFHSASQVSDPRFIKGKPFLFATAPSLSLARLTGPATTGSARHEFIAAPPQSSAPPTEAAAPGTPAADTSAPESPSPEAQKGLTQAVSSVEKTSAPESEQAPGQLKKAQGLMNLQDGTL